MVMFSDPAVACLLEILPAYPELLNLQTTKPCPSELCDIFTQSYFLTLWSPIMVPSIQVLCSKNTACIIPISFRLRIYASQILLVRRVLIF